MATALFTYGSLMFPEVWNRIVKGRYEQARGLVQGYQRYTVLGMTYPGLIKQAGASVEGMVYFNIGVNDLITLDGFEGKAYERCSIQVELAGGQQIKAQTYLFLTLPELSDHLWDPRQFAMQGFLRTHF